MAYGLPYVGVTLSLFTTAVVCLALVSGSFACETVRAGINGVPVGQAEAARAIGMTFSQSLATIILPQALRTMVQPLVNIFIAINSAVIAEIVRAGIRALDRGQTEAALAIGMTGGAAMRHVVMPQAIKLVIPSLVTQLVALLKDSTLGYVVSYPELMKQANTLANNTHLLLQSFVIVSLIYIVFNFALTRLATWLEQRLRQRPGGRPARSSGPADEPQPDFAEEIQNELPSAVAR